MYFLSIEQSYQYHLGTKLFYQQYLPNHSINQLPNPSPFPDLCCPGVHAGDQPVYPPPELELQGGGPGQLRHQLHQVRDDLQHLRQGGVGSIN